MTYAHTFRYAPESEAFRRAWPRMVADAARIVGYLATTGLAVRSRTGYSVPEFDRGTDGVIAFNGSAWHDGHRQPFVIRPSVPDRRRDPLAASRYARDGYVTGYCDTGRAPYDVAVAAVLLRCHQLAPTAFTIASDGGWLVEWQHGAETWAGGPRGLTPPAHGPAGRVPVAARPVVAALFGDAETRCPFTDDGPADRDPVPGHTGRTRN